MHERIRQLSKQAWDYVQECDERYSKTSTQLFDEKFAELVVKECAQVGSKAMYPDSDPDYVGRKIRQHFGVEE